ncbi:alpha/beta fold hydrolase [Amycolatopsis sp.]|jgi:pimeloyl-ACP methyl ester carboxylesterase|uniref:alpha/beta fold hydrolase n=1 Tax=Amycolatopsis sp. TaxID=37632 RepID=UPI002E0C5EEB|nr:alpha/beta fold hydrolase [Amycolatopsis sp.]
MDEVVFTRTGRGEPLVLIHGVGHRRQAWDPVVPLLAPHRDVIAVDLPGFGESPPHDGIYGIDTALAAFAKFFAEVGLDRPHVAGNSLGGLLSLALGEAGLVRSVTALSPAGLWTPQQQRYALGVLRAHRQAAKYLPERLTARLAAGKVGRTLIAGMIFDKPWLLSPERIMEDAQAFATAPGFLPTLAEAKGGFHFEGPVTGVPVTIAWAARDRILARPKADYLRRVAPEAELLLLRGCGHVPMSDDPELVAKVLLDGSHG